MFAEIAPRYDFVNRMLSGGIDTLWRRFTVKHAPPINRFGSRRVHWDRRSGTYVRGKGEFTSPCRGSDFCRPMLDRGIEKSATRNLPVEWIEADAMDLPFPGII